MNSIAGPRASISKILPKTAVVKETKDTAKYPYAGKKSDKVLVIVRYSFFIINHKFIGYETR